MSHTRYKVVFILLVLILLVASTLFGLLTYWVNAEVLPASAPGQGGMVPAEQCPSSFDRAGQSGRDIVRLRLTNVPQSAPSSPGRRGFCQEVGI